MDHQADTEGFTFPQGRGGEFVETDLSAKITDLLRSAQSAGFMSMISGASGIGKTMACKRFTETHKRVTYVQFSPDTKSVFAVLYEIAVALKVYEIPRTPHELRYRIQSFLGGIGALIVADEAQNLTRDGLELMRSLCERMQCGVVFVGHPELSEKIAAVASVHNRLKAPIRIGSASVADAEKILDAMGFPEGACRADLRRLATGPMGVRMVASIVEEVQGYALAKGTMITPEIVRAATARYLGPISAE